MNTPDVPAWLIDHLVKREELQSRAAAERLASFTERERLLIKEAAVMGWAQGMRHHDIPIPKDSVIVMTIMEEELQSRAAAERLASFTERERLLIKEAAVMSWVQGMRHHDIPIPKDSVIAMTIMGEAQGIAPDLYPLLTGWEPAPDDEEEEDTES